MGVVPRIPDGMHLLGVRVRYARVGCTLRIGGVNVTRKPQILILTQSTHHTSVKDLAWECPSHGRAHAALSRVLSTSPLTIPPELIPVRVQIANL